MIPLMFSVAIAREFAKFLAESGAQIISGLALGIDAAAHVGALMSNQEGSTIAVLGNGLEIIYPATHMQLANKIIQAKGAILSQFMPGEGPMKHHFLMRNRVIAALADAIIVIQAPKKSGAISTVIHAIEFGKDVFVVPGSIKDPRYEGSNNLIKQGAGVITGPEDLFSLLPSVLKKQNKAVKILHLTEEEAVFMEKIPTEGIFADDLLIDSKNHEIFCIMLSSGVLIQDLNGKIRKKT